MSKRLYVGGLPYSITSSQLEEMFSKFGAIVSANVISDKFTNQSKGFGFVEMEKEKEADEAIKKLNDTEVEGRRIMVNEARPREERPSFEDRGQRRNFGGSNRRGRRY